MRISLFFGALFLAYGVIVPYFPVWLDARGLELRCKSRRSPRLPLFIRLVVTPAIGLLADRLGNYRLVIVTLAWCATGAYLWPEPRFRLRADPRHRRRLPAGERHHAAADRDDGGLADGARRVSTTAACGCGVRSPSSSLTLSVASPSRQLGGGFALWLIAFAGMSTIAAAHALPPPPVTVRTATVQRFIRRASSPARLLQSRLFILFLIAIGCTHGAHATFYTFGALHWQAQGLSAAWVGTLWAIGVVAEVVLFALSAPVVRRFGPAKLIVAGATASVLRWGVMTFDPPLAVLIPLQLLHALTYGAAHLGAILFITRAVPHKGMGSAQAFYATIAAGLALGIVGLISQLLSARVGGEVYVVPTVVALIGCVASVMLLYGWSAGALWADDADTEAPSPTAPAVAG